MIRPAADPVRICFDIKQSVASGWALYQQETETAASDAVKTGRLFRRRLMECSSMGSETLVGGQV
jgi:hypothetical protein